ncbi:casein kinase II beta [Nadsonia fulvescens var. elongata DSM 6958]|uniref:Casein kinase II subunit beta n=1 Tax=Nadsonia fulvescens var. elongata DSM 6958 TaxID=857566 RepID=A0A1E3PJQ7_9ASCO|nr:casein kinase II beta [Nadsonia fulvescens var. elongata DSM 6958]
MTAPEEYGSGSDYSEEYWVDWFLGAKGNEYFCDVEQDFILDRFNLTGLQSEVEHFQLALDLITDELDLEEFSEDHRYVLDESARKLYGLIHARFILSPRGLQKMLEKYKNSDFGRCPRLHCNLHPLLPIGIYEKQGQGTVKLYCSKCEELYNPKSIRHSNIDGAYFGANFPAMLMQTFANIIPAKPKEIYVPKIFGFKIHEQAKLARWKEKKRSEMEVRLSKDD